MLQKFKVTLYVVQLLNGVQLGLYSNFELLKKIQIGSLFMIPRHVPNVALCLEAKLIRIQDQIWQGFFISIAEDPSGLFFILISGKHRSQR